MENLNENNKLIAEFMGAQLYPPNDYDIHSCTMLDVTEDEGQQHFTPEQMLFNSSWDWLMPVVQQCYESQQFGENNLIGDITHALVDIDIEEVNKAVIAYIKWHNNQ